MFLRADSVNKFSLAFDSNSFHSIWTWWSADSVNCFVSSVLYDNGCINLMVLYVNLRIKSFILILALFQSYCTTNLWYTISKVYWESKGNFLCVTWPCSRMVPWEWWISQAHWWCPEIADGKEDHKQHIQVMRGCVRIRRSSTLMAAVKPHWKGYQLTLHCAFNAVFFGSVILTARSTLLLTKEISG